MGVHLHVNVCFGALYSKNELEAAGVPLFDDNYEFQAVAVGQSNGGACGSLQPYVCNIFRLPEEWG